MATNFGKNKSYILKERITLAKKEPTEINQKFVSFRDVILILITVWMRMVPRNFIITYLYFFL